MLVNRIIRAIKLDKTLYPEVKPLEALTNEALMIFIAVILARVIGEFLGNLIGGVPFGTTLLLVVIALVFGAIGWGLFIFVAQYAGTKLFGGQATTFKEMLRTLGYAQSPALVGLLFFIPILGPIIAWLGSLWALVTSVIAIRETLGLDTTKAILTAIIAWVVEVVVIAVLSGLVTAPIIAAAILARY